MKSIFKKCFFWVVFVSFFIFISNGFNISIYAQSKSVLGESGEEDYKGIVKKIDYVPGEVIVKYKNENLIKDSYIYQNMNCKKIERDKTTPQFQHINYFNYVVEYLCEKK